jgi:hypothetical protein
LRRLWRRLVRVFCQSRIRLPERSLYPAALQPGDWIQIESGVWRVKSSSRGLGLHRIELETPDGRARAALLRSGENTLWTFQQGRDRLEVPADAVLVFPAGSCGEAAKDRRRLHIDPASQHRCESCYAPCSACDTLSAHESPTSFVEVPKMFAPKKMPGLSTKSRHGEAHVTPLRD